jgi:hypothetical protein
LPLVADVSAAEAVHVTNNQPDISQPSHGIASPDDDILEALIAGSHRLWRRFRQFNADQVEIRQRLWLINRPWEEEFLHWAYDGHQWQLHGFRTPPDNRHRATTSSGWCTGLRRRPSPHQPSREEADEE